MKAALLALMISILSILPAQAMTFQELGARIQGAPIINIQPCGLPDQQKTYTCVDFLWEDQTHRAIVDGEDPSREVYELVTWDPATGEVIKLDPETFEVKGEITPEQKGTTG